MATNRSDVNPKEENPPQFGLAKFLFVLILTVTVYLLTRSMVRHHFFSGGQLNQHESAEP